MQDFVYLKNAGEHRVEVPLEPLNVPGLATVLKLRPLGLRIGMTILNPDANGQCASFPDVVHRLRQEDASIGTTEDKAILVEGDTAGAAGAGASAGLVTVHVRKDRKDLPVYRIPIANGTVNLKEVQKDECVVIEGVAVSDTADQVPAYQPLKDYDVPAQAGQHVFIKAKSTGTPWLIKVLFP